MEAASLTENSGETKQRGGKVVSTGALRGRECPSHPKQNYRESLILTHSGFPRPVYTRSKCTLLRHWHVSGG